MPGDVCNYKVTTTQSTGRYPIIGISGLSEDTAPLFHINYFEFDDTEDGSFLPNSND